LPRQKVADERHLLHVMEGVGRARAGSRDEIDIKGKEFQDISDGHWYIPPETCRDGHLTPFPEELIYRLIKFYTFRGNIALDMFGGTGTVQLWLIEQIGSSSILTSQKSIAGSRRYA